MTEDVHTDALGDLALSLKADNLIKSYTFAALGVSIIPLPVIELIGITAIQLLMIQKLSQVYEKPFRKELALTTLGSVVATLGGVAGSYVATALLRLIPGVGQMIAIAGGPIASASATYAVGQVFKRHYEDGGSLVDLDASKFKGFVREQYQRGRDLARAAVGAGNEQPQSAAA